MLMAPPPREKNLSFLDHYRRRRRRRRRSRAASHSGVKLKVPCLAHYAHTNTTKVRAYDMCAALPFSRLAEFDIIDGDPREHVTNVGGLLRIVI